MRFYVVCVLAFVGASLGCGSTSVPGTATDTGTVTLYDGSVSFVESDATGSCFGTTGSCDYAIAADASPVEDSADADAGLASTADADTSTGTTDAQAAADDALSAADQAVLPPDAETDCQRHEDCNDGKACTLDRCEGGRCENIVLTGLSCDDQDLCTYSDTCSADGECRGTAIACNDDPGTCGARRVCDGTASCSVTYPAAGLACDDGTPCTTGDSCNGAGMCTGSLVTGWQRAVAIERPQSTPYAHWSEVQQKSWNVPRSVTGLRVSGYADEGGYCYAHWGTGHIAAYNHDGFGGLYNVDNNVYFLFCPQSPPYFDDDGNAKLCQLWLALAGPLTRGTKETSMPPGAGTTVQVKAQHTIGPNAAEIKCYLDYKCD